MIAATRLIDDGQEIGSYEVESVNDSAILFNLDVKPLPSALSNRFRERLSRLARRPMMQVVFGVGVNECGLAKQFLKR